MNSLKTSQTIMAFSSSTVTIAATIVTTVTAQAAPVDYGATRVAQAKVLLRPVKMYGHVGKPLTQLPPTLNTLLNAPLSVVSTEQLRKYLHKRGISSALLGGPLQSLTETRYFVIHDTSSP